MDSTTKKFIKKTNLAQFQQLVSCMEAYPHLATGSPAFGSSRAAMEYTWDTVAQKVNALGPPERSGSEWKKIWADQKCRVKKKISDNNKELHATGGGPCRISNLNEMELDIDRICRLSSAASPRGEVFGTSKIKRPELAPSSQNCSMQITPPTTSNLQNEPTISTTPQPTITSTPKHSKQIKVPSVEPVRPFKQGKRKHNEVNTEKHEQLKLLRRQIDTQNEALEIVKAQAEQIKVIAQSTKVISEALVDIVKHLKDD